MRLNFLIFILLFSKWIQKNKNKNKKNNNNKKKMSRCQKSDCVKKLKVKKFVAKNACINNLRTKNLKSNTIEADKLILDGTDIGCLIKRVPSITVSPEFDCMVDGVPQKPDNINQDVWDVLTCNREQYRLQLEEDYLAGREEIRCIRKAYGCEECPPDCPIPENPNCPTECPTFPNDCELLPQECIPDWKTCPLIIENKLFKTKTFPFVTLFENECELVTDNNTFPYSRTRFTKNIGFDLDITNVSCNLATRVASVLVHFAFVEGSTGTVGPTGPTGSVCPGETGATGLTCFEECVTDTSVVCGIIRLTCKQYYYTININLGEGFSGSIPIDSLITQAMIDATPLPLDPNNIIGAIQLVVFFEDGLEISNNKGSKGGSTPAPTASLNAAQDTCFNGEAKITMADGKIKLAKNVQVGDELLSTSGDITKVMAVIRQEERPKSLVKIENLLISKPHRILYEGKWIKPLQHPNAELVQASIQLYNFITEDCRPFIVEGIIASSIGQYCEGAHDLSKPMHKLWASNHIVDIFKSHPQWPNINLKNDDNFLNIIKNPEFADEYFKSDDKIYTKLPIIEEIFMF